MPVNRNALIRYKTIDKALQNRQRKWTLQDLIDTCSDALYEYEGIDAVSKRTVQGDIQMMRSDKLGYNAPIEVVERKYYRYSDPNYSITNIPLTNQDLEMLMEAVEFMKQFQGFAHFQQLGGMVQKLEDHIHASKDNSVAVIDFEKNEHLRGLEFLDPLYKAITQKKAVFLQYQSFKARNSSDFDFHPYLLKEFRNRWFVIGVSDDRDSVLNLALDRIKFVQESTKSLRENVFFNPKTHFDKAIGVTISPTQKVEHVEFFVPHAHAQYVLTKPLHFSQQVELKDAFGITFSIKVQLNFELEKEILALGDNIRVIQPERLKKSIIKRMQTALDIYESELGQGKLDSLVDRIKHKGYVHFNSVFIRRDINKLTARLDKHVVIPISESVVSIMDKEVLLAQIWNNANMDYLLEAMGTEHFLIGANYTKRISTQIQQTWNQEEECGIPEQIYNLVTKKMMRRNFSISEETWNENVKIISIFLDKTKGIQASNLDYYSSSHKKIMKDSEIEIITQNNEFASLTLPLGGILIRHPYLLVRDGMSISQRAFRRVDLYVWSNTN